MDNVNIFLDMDGTLARFYEQSNCLELMNTDGFFANLKPYSTFIDNLATLKKICGDKVRYHIITAINAKQPKFDAIKAEKQCFINKYLSRLAISPSDILMIKYGSSKPEAVGAHLGRNLSSIDLLIDDYNVNLIDWQENGGTPIKFVNEINNNSLKGERFFGHKIKYNDAISYDDLLDIMYTVQQTARH